MNILKNYGVDIESSLSFWGDETSYNEGLKEFLTSLPEKIKNLEYYKDSRDYTNYGILAHSTKSEAKYLGFMQDAEIFLAHEKAGKEGNSEFINTEFNNLKETINRLIDLLNEYFDTSTSSKKTILIADDSSIMQNFIEKLIQNDYQVIKASNGKIAIEELKNKNIYAIMLDLNMPTVNGFEVLEYMKENELFEKIPAVIITGDDSEETIKKAFTYPILDILNKPFKEENIARVLISINNFHEN